MHTYSIDSSIRRAVYVALGVIAFGFPAWISELRNLVGLPQAISYPVSFGVTFGALHLIFDRWAWRILPKFSLLPNLNGAWIAEGVSSYQGKPFTGKVTIKQTFSAMEIFGDFEESTSRSTLSGFCLDHAVPVFRYAFDNSPKNMANQELQRHPGLIELRIYSVGEMRGDYFSGKHRLRYGEIALRREP